eukprot:CAMPEP_0201592764 /NCGR_PEP_ID=MMETSP0190_2-20130828/190567_1 /ASSEMBLY_ACC=CAM_ASM_000263 /TAXON_ID=37353 /ORGANISM="Rosalina sp." /LENGTH=475 /DNA_ID=CAMNT_0048051681 /DNA_START=55 /DNA_END=1479 /DNA_ORIENTATION=-
MATNYQQFGDAERGMKKNERVKTVCGAFLIGALTASLITWGAMELSNKDSSSSTSCTNKSYLTQPEPTTEQADALSDIHDIFANSTWISSPMSDDDKSKAQDAYDIFDEDEDGTWSYDEFVTYKSLLANHTTFFDTIDVDNDTIVSIREFVGYFRNIGGVGKYILNRKFEDRVKYSYGLDETNITAKSQLFHEYVVDIIFQNFDGNGKGYFNLTDFQYMFYNRSFRYFDRDDDNMVSFNEFLESQFHQSNIDKPSETFKLFRNTLRGNTTYISKDGTTKQAPLYIQNDYDHTDTAAIFRITISSKNIDKPSETFKLFRNTLRGNTTYISKDGTTKQAPLYTKNDYDHTDTAALNLSVCPIAGKPETAINYAENFAVVSGGRRRLSCLWDSLDCGVTGVETAASCGTAIAGDGAVIPDDIECGGKVVELGSSCYDAWNSCFGSSDDSSSGSSGSSSYSSYGEDSSYSSGYGYGGYG